MGKKDRVKIDGCQVTLKHFGLICYEESFYEALDWYFCSLTFSSVSFAWAHLRYYSHPFHSPWPLNVDGSWRTSLWDSPFLLVSAWQRQPPVFTSHFAMWAFYELTSHAWPLCQATCWLQLSARQSSSISNSGGLKLDPSVYPLFCWVSGFHGRRHHFSGVSSVRPTTLNPVSLSLLSDLLSDQHRGVFYLWASRSAQMPLFPCSLPMLAPP